MPNQMLIASDSGQWNVCGMKPVGLALVAIKAVYKSLEFINSYQINWFLTTTVLRTAAYRRLRGVALIQSYEAIYATQQAFAQCGQWVMMEQLRVKGRRYNQNIIINNSS